MSTSSFSMDTEEQEVGLRRRNSMDVPPTMSDAPLERLNLVLCGRDAAVKASISDVMLGQREQRAEPSSVCVRRDGEVCGHLLTLVEMPALYNTQLSEEEVMQQTLHCVSLCYPGVHAFLFTIPEGYLTDEDKAEMETMQRIFSSRVHQHTIVLISQDTQQENLELDEAVRTFTETCKGGHHHFGSNSGVSVLIDRVKQLLVENNGEVYTSLMYLDAHVETRRYETDMTDMMGSTRTHETKMKSQSQDQQITLALFGTSTAVNYGNQNILLGQRQSVGPRQRSISGRKVSVINLLALQETEPSTDKVLGKLIGKNTIHTFIFVLNLGNFTKHNLVKLEWLQRTFGENVLQFVMPLLTYEKEENGDTIIDELKKNPALDQLLEKCRGRYHICNKNMNVQSEMTDLLVKIDEMVSENNPPCYTAEMYSIVLKVRRGLQDCMDQEKSIMTKHVKQKNTKQHYNIILLGEKGAGKSSTGNTIVGPQSFSSKKMLKFRKFQKESVKIDGVNLDVYDIQGEFDSGSSKEDATKKLFRHIDESVPTVVLLVIKPEIHIKDEKHKMRSSVKKSDTLNSNYQKTVELLEDLPHWLRQNTWLLFTRGDELERENLTIEEIIDQSEELKKCVQKLQNRYHVFNNMMPKNSNQVIELIEKMNKTQLKMPPKIVYFSRIMQTASERNPNERRIVLLGKTGAGKSATANTILGEERFISDLCTSSVTAESEMEQTVVAGRNVTIVDTPGLFDTSISAEDLAIEIGKSIYLSSPGPHAFLYVLQINLRFTEQEEHVVQKFEMMFGQEMRKYTIVLLTQGDQLEGKSPEMLIKKNSSLSKLVDKCGGGFHVFNNKDQSNRDQVIQLMEKIDKMVEKNGGNCYCNQMFEDAARFRQEEEERRQMKGEARKQEEKQQKANKWKIRKRKETERTGKEMKDAMKKEKERGMKVMQEDRKQSEEKDEIKSTSTRTQEDTRLKNERSVQLNQTNYNYTESLETNMDTGFKRFLQEHENHLDAAGHVGTGRKVAIGAGAGAASGAILGALIGIIGGPPGVAIGAAIGACVGAALGAAGGAIKARLS